MRFRDTVTGGLVADKSRTVLRAFWVSSVAMASSTVLIASNVDLSRIAMDVPSDF